MKYTITAIKAKGVWLVCDANGWHLRTAYTLAHAKRIVQHLQRKGDQDGSTQ